MPTAVQIRLLGQFAVEVDGVDLVPRLLNGKKGNAFLQYLILQRGAVASNQQLCEALWPEEHNANPESALKTLVSRLRATLSKCSDALGRCIITEHGGYCFNRAAGVAVDLYEFEEIARRLLGDKTAETIEAQRQTVEPERTDAAEGPLYARVAALYRGDLLASSAVQESWLVAQQQRARTLYFKLVHQYAGMLEGQGRTEALIAVCRHALEIDPLQERLELMLMNALIRCGDISGALVQYRRTAALYGQYLDGTPPQALVECYRRLIGAARSPEEAFADFYGESGAECGAGTLVCELATFKTIVRLIALNQEHLKRGVHVLTVEIGETNGVAFAPEQMNRIVQDLQDVLCTVLQKGSVISRFTALRFVALLFTSSRRRCEWMAARIEKAFYRRYEKAEVPLRCRVDILRQDLNRQARP